VADLPLVVRWMEVDGSSPMGRPAELEIRWLDELPLPTVGEILETEIGVVLEVIGRAFEVSARKTPRPVLHCKLVATVGR
jgi:hypothetical protein